MSSIDWFSFEKKNRDFPFYRKNPHVSKRGWIVLLFSIIIGYFVMGLVPDELVSGVLFFLIMLLPVVYYLDWDYKAIFQKPEAREVGLAVLLFVGYIVYTVVMVSVLDVFSLTGSSVVSSCSITPYYTLALFPLLMGEELFKFIPFMFFMRIVYKFSENRKLSVILSMIIIMVFFALLHAMDMKSIVSVLVLQGFGSIFEFYGYIKTKNLLISYITHLCTDLSIFLLFLL